ncbi:O-antigen ligase family protein [Flavobacteriaceae bacterium 3-367]|uniref:O-antigen ligase family protein n=1 Tax=Eudoraea algarum TaxID=3417568 RepID=UPI0032714264
MNLTTFEKIVTKADPLKWSAALFALSFTLGIAINSIAFFLFLFIGITITLNDVFKGNIKVDFKQFNLVLMALFLIIAIRETVEHASNIVDVVYYYLSFLLLPLVIGFQANKMKGYLPIILKWFLIGCLVNATVNLGFAIYRGVLIRDEGINFWYFTYQFLVEPFGIQPIYLGFFYVFALLILVKLKHFGNNKFFYYFAFTLLTLSIVLLAARNAILCMLILVPAYLVVVGKGVLKKMLIASGIIGICFVVALQNPVIKNRVLKVNKKGNFYSGASLRYDIWESAYTVSKENFLWGLGEKKADTLLLKEFETRDLKIPLKHKYHAHSQYLQTLLHYGIVGLLLLFAAFLWPLRRALAYRNTLAIFWFFLVVLTAITESIFTRQWAIYNFAFFSCLFLLKPRE